MDSVLALAIITLIAFVGVLFTAAIYLFAVRPRLLEPEPAIIDLDEMSSNDLLRTQVEKLSAALARHTEQLNAPIITTESSANDELASLLRAQSDAVHTLSGLVNEQADRLAGLDERLTRQDEKLDRLANKLDGLNVPAPDIQAQADKLAQIGARLDEWAEARARSDEKMSEQARILAELDREIAAQAQTVRQLDTKVSEHTTMLVTAATERREQATLLQRILDQIGQLVPAISQVAKAPAHHHHPGQERLTDIKGIGPVYASKLYEAGIQTFRQLAAMTPEEVYTLLNLPAWRLRSADVPDWIEQAEQFASQREKVEKLQNE